MLQFDERGHLYPYEVIETNLAEFERVFVSSFPESSTWKVLFENFKGLIEKLSIQIGEGFYAWIDGSFVTKKINPGDIDVICFVNYESFSRSKLIWMNTEWLKVNEGIDLYFAEVYPANHPNYFYTQFSEVKWIDIFGYSRPDNGRIYRKGIIKIQY